MLTEYIKSSWDSCVRENKEDDGTLIGLPYPYIVPTPAGRWKEMYYWDTFFTCKGLMLTGRNELVKNCTDNMLYLVEKFGFMPNGNRTYYLSQSQPPFLSMMVMDVYKLYNDKKWLKKAYETLKKEYTFWMTKRITPTGLNRFGVNPESIKDADKHYESICRRINYQVPSDNHMEFAENFLADCESGWDFNPRTEMKQKQFAYVDLNSNLYIYEKNFAYYAEVLENGEAEKWNLEAEKRKSLINKYLWNKDSFMDYNFVEKRAGKVFSAASFYPLWAGIADKEQAKATVKKLNTIEFEFGISACCENDSPAMFQWDYPIGWAPLHYIVICGLDNYGYKSEAERICRKYTGVIEKLYEETGTMWEKYDVRSGSKDVKIDYGSDVMIGWTAGVYLYAKDYIKNAEGRLK